MKNFEEKLFFILPQLQLLQIIYLLLLKLRKYSIFVRRSDISDPGFV